MKIIASSIFAGALLTLAVPAFAGAPAAPSPTPLGDSLSLEVSPEFGATSPYAYKDTYAKIGFSHSLGSGWSWGTSLQVTANATAPANPVFGTGAFQPETTLGYKWKQDALTFGVSAGVGYNSGAWSSSSVTSPAVGAYYLASGTIDWKLDSKWTWNVVNARYRNAFNLTWITPKVATGVTYNIDARQSTYFAVGYAWKDTGNGAGLVADKINLALGYKLGF
jgi:hypothetical protein